MYKRQSIPSVESVDAAVTAPKSTAGIKCMTRNDPIEVINSEPAARGLEPGVGVSLNTSAPTAGDSKSLTGPPMVVSTAAVVNAPVEAADTLIAKPAASVTAPTANAESEAVATVGNDLSTTLDTETNTPVNSSFVAAGPASLVKSNASSTAATALCTVDPSNNTKAQPTLASMANREDVTAIDDEASDLPAPHVASTVDSSLATVANASGFDTPTNDPTDALAAEALDATDGAFPSVADVIEA